MKQRYILYNPKAGNGRCRENVRALEILYNNTQCYDITQMENYADFFRALDASDEVILCGGDGTLHRFANDTKDLVISNPIYYFAAGNSNDFIHDLDLPENADPDFRINDYLRGLPSVSIHGQKYLFLNNVGFGMDDCCRAESECLCKERKRNGRKRAVNDRMAAVRELLFRFKPREVIVTVDGVSHRFKKVWLAPTMHGRYCGGMMVAPGQDRLNTDKTLSVMVIHDAGRLRFMCMLPFVSKGKHIRYKKYVTVLTGHEVTVEFDRPTSLQIDGEMIPDVRTYRAKSSMSMFMAQNAANGKVHV